VRSTEAFSMIRLPQRALFLALIAFIGCAASPPEPAAADLQRLHEARFVLLGEVHDNAEQHRQRAALLSRLLADGRPTTVVFEQMERTQDAALAEAPRDAEALASAGRLDRKAWQWPLHRPILEAAVAGQAELRGGNLPLAEVRAVVKDGLAAVPADLRPALATPGWTPVAEAELERDIDQGHCHALPPSMWVSMALAQRARDAAMAGAMLQAPTSRVVLIAGNGHARRDRGVAFYLRQAGAADRDIISVGYLEENEPAEADDTGFDIVYRTPPAKREDRCAAFKTR